MQIRHSFEDARAFSNAADIHDKLSSLQLKELLDAQGVRSDNDDHGAHALLWNMLAS